MIVLSAASAHAIPLRDGTVHAVVTSPPYFSLRRYEGEQAIEWPSVSYAPMPGLKPVEVAPMRGALGLEPTPEAYIAHLVLCFREMRRVLREDGVCWAVMGDSYAAGGTGGAPSDKSTLSRHGSDGRSPQLDALGKAQSRKPPTNLHPGDLMLIPHRLALALQADGWTCRNDVVWSKVAPMPESVAGWRWERHRVKVHQATHPALVRHGDRGEHGNPPHSGDIREHPDRTRWENCPGCPKCEATGGYVLRRGSWRHTRSHEYVLMLTKGMGYYADQEKVREGSTGQMGAAAELRRETKDHLLPGQAAIQHRMDRKPRSDNGTRNPRDVLTADELDELWAMFLAWMADDNPLDVLTPRPESYKKNHYAVYPASLITPLIRASCPTRCCPVCGAAWAPVVERGEPQRAGWDFGPGKRGTKVAHDDGPMERDGHSQWSAGHYPTVRESRVLDYRPTCICRPQYGCYECDGRGCESCDYTGKSRHGPVPGTILDPFCGSGTTLAVARELGLNAIGFDLSAEYLDQHSMPRIGLTPSKAFKELPLFEGMNL